MSGGLLENAHLSDSDWNSLRIQSFPEASTATPAHEYPANSELHHQLWHHYPDNMDHSPLVTSLSQDLNINPFPNLLQLPNPKAHANRPEFDHYRESYDSAFGMSEKRHEGFEWAHNVEKGSLYLFNQAQDVRNIRGPSATTLPQTDIIQTSGPQSYNHLDNLAGTDRSHYVTPHEHLSDLDALRGALYDDPNHFNLRGLLNHLTPHKSFDQHESGELDQYLSRTPTLSFMQPGKKEDLTYTYPSRAFERTIRTIPSF